MHGRPTWYELWFTLYIITIYMYYANFLLHDVSGHQHWLSLCRTKMYLTGSSDMYTCIKCTWSYSRRSGCSSFYSNITLTGAAMFGWISMCRYHTLNFSVTFMNLLGFNTIRIPHNSPHYNIKCHKYPQSSTVIWFNTNINLLSCRGILCMDSQHNVYTRLEW